MPLAGTLRPSLADDSNMSNVFLWRGRPVRFDARDTVASALWRHGITDFGSTPRGGSHAVFCGIGQCQACLVMSQDGHVFEACLHRPSPQSCLSGVMDVPPGADNCSTQGTPCSDGAITSASDQRGHGR